MRNERRTMANRLGGRRAARASRSASLPFTVVLAFLTAADPARGDGGRSGGSRDLQGVGGGDQFFSAGGAGGAGNSTISGGAGGGAGSTGGTGGTSPFMRRGGAGGATPGADGADGQSSPVADAMGGGGGGGGAHGAVLGSTVLSGVVRGGHGGRGGDAYNLGAGGGGAGGFGAVVTGGATVTNGGTIQGGAGGAAGKESNAEFGADGGSGGMGLGALQPVTIVNTGSIAGGDGGGGGSNVGCCIGQGGAGGAGGAGVTMRGGGTLTNRGTISGGRGGAGGMGATSTGPGLQGAAGAGGAGVTGANLTVITSGMISGGLSGDGISANAITFTGGRNTLELQEGYGFRGNVVGAGADTLRLGGSAAGVFDLSELGVRFTGFSGVQKIGTSVWTLIGTQTTGTPWEITRGTLKIGDGADISSAASIKVDGTLDISANSNGTLIQNLSGGSTGALVLGDQTLGIRQSTSGHVFAGTISGTGTLWKSGSGDLGLSGSLSGFSGSVTVEDGALRLQGGADLGGASSTTLSQTATLDFSGHGGATTLRDLSGAPGSRLVLGATDLALNYPTMNAFAGSVTGTGTLTKQGRGTLMLTGDMSGFTGGVVVAGGTLTPAGSGGLSAARSVTVDGTLDLTMASDRRIPSLSSRSTTGRIEFGVDPLIVSQDRDGVYSGALSGTATLTKVGAGRLVLAGNSPSMTGPLWVGAGTAQVDGSLGGGARVFSGATLGGSGSITGPVAVDAGGVLSGGGGATLTMGSLMLDGGSTVRAALGTPGGSAAFNVRGDLALAGNLDVVDAGGFGPGSYRLFDYGGRLTGPGLTIRSTPAGVSPDALRLQTSVGHQVNLISSAGAALQFWNGSTTDPDGVVHGGSGGWSASGTNWTDATGTLAGRMAPQPGFALFQGSAGVVTVDGRAGPVAAFGLQFQTSGYRITGDPLTLASPSGRSIIRVGDGSAAGAATTARVDASLSGSNGLDKMDYGTLLLGGANRYSGQTTISQGSLALVGAGSIAASAGVSVAGRFDISGVSGTGTSIKTLSGSGAVALGSKTLTLTAANDTFSGTIAGTGGLVLAGGRETLDGDSSYSGGTVVTGGTLRLASSKAAGTGAIALADSGVLELADGTSIANALTLSGSVALSVPSGTTRQTGTMTGSGTARLASPGTLILAGDASGYSGTMLLGTGKLVVGDEARPDATFGGRVAVSGHGVIGGFGTIGSLDVGAGGTVAPGNSIGTLHVAGSVAFAPGSTFQVEITPDGRSDRLEIGGTATLGSADVSVVKAGGSYLPGTRYTILSARGGLQGSFGALSQNLPFLDLRLSYDPNDVYLDVARNNVSFASVAVTRNEIATARAADTLGVGNALYDKLSAQGGVADARRAFNALSGEIYPSAIAGLVQDSRIASSAALERLRWGDAWGGGEAAGTESLAGSFWARGVGQTGRLSGDGNASALRREMGGLFVGYDAKPDPESRIGFSAGYTNTRFAADAVSSSVSGNSYHAMVYGARSFGPVALRLGGAMSWSDLNSRRTIAFPGAFDMTRAGYSAQTAQVFGEIGYRLPVAGAMLEPFAGLALVDVRSGGFQESGTLAALAGRGAEDQARFSTLGLHAAMTFDVFGLSAKARGTIGWQHAFGDLTPRTRLSFAGSPDFAISGTPLAADAMILDAGLDLKLSENAELGLSYQNSMAATAHESTLRGRFSVKF